MSCGGCGNNSALPASVTLRLEAARIAIAAQPNAFEATSKAVYEFVTSGVDLSTLDTPLLPIAVGEGADAVTSRNALINAPLSRVVGLPHGAATRMQISGVSVLGALVQWRAPPGRQPISSDDYEAIDKGLAHYGLRLGMTTDAVRAWVLQGPQA